MSQGIIEQVDPLLEYFGPLFEAPYPLTSTNSVQITSNFNNMNILMTKIIYLRMKASKLFSVWLESGSNDVRKLRHPNHKVLQIVGCKIWSSTSCPSFIKIRG